MALTEKDIVDAVRAAADAQRAIEILGRGSLLRRLPDPPACVEIEVSRLQGIRSYEPEELTVTVAPGTPTAELADALAASGQECPLEGPGETVGGQIASGLSGVRRLGLGHIREWLLGGRVVTGEGVALRFGAPTVKNVSGYDVPRILCGSWGTLGVLTELTLRIRPRPRFQGWFFAREDSTLIGRVDSPAAVVRTRAGTFVLLEGHPKDCAEQAGRFNLSETEAPYLPQGVRISVPPREVDRILPELEGDFATELGVGVIHASPSEEAMPRIARCARAAGGRMLAFGDFPSLPSQLFMVSNGVADLASRVKHAFDPFGLFAPWRLAS